MDQDIEKRGNPVYPDDTSARNSTVEQLYSGTRTPDRPIISTESDLQGPKRKKSPRNIRSRIGRRTALKQMAVVASGAAIGAVIGAEVYSQNQSASASATKEAPPVSVVAEHNPTSSSGIFEAGKRLISSIFKPTLDSLEAHEDAKAEAHKQMIESKRMENSRYPQIGTVRKPGDPAPEIHTQPKEKEYHITNGPRPEEKEAAQPSAPIGNDQSYKIDIISANGNNQVPPNPDKTN